jgi:pSer/pThr/pTyr-binding forkhead associated (FHA) protein
MLTTVTTKTDPTAREWVIDDDVVRLREWGTDAIHVLPQPPIDVYTVGTDTTCALRLEDPSQRVSRVHARLVRDQGQWRLRDTDSKNGVRADGAHRREILLGPGLELGIGGITLVAESVLSIALRSFLARLLGWGSDRTAIVDQALRAVRMAAARRAALVLCGGDDLVPIAHSLHRRSRGADRPFVVCDPRRKLREATVRSAESQATGMEALAAAAGGSLCVHGRRLPCDFREVAQLTRAPSSQVQLIVCARTPGDCERYCATPIGIPPLTGRGAELDRIIDEYAEDAMTELATPRTAFAAADRTWVRQHASRSLPEIEKATRRLVALRISHTLSDAAARLGMAPVSLSRWIGRRHLPMEIVP